MSGTHNVNVYPSYVCVWGGGGGGGGLNYDQPREKKLKRLACSQNEAFKLHVAIGPYI